MAGGKRNRTAGHKFERECVAIMKSIGFHDCASSRSSNRSRDDQKVDLVNKDEFKSGRLPWAIQCKNVKGHLKYAPILAEMPKEKDITKVIFHNQTEKVGNRFVTRDQFAILYLEDFVAIMKKLKDHDTQMHQHKTS